MSEVSNTSVEKSGKQPTGNNEIEKVEVLEIDLVEKGRILWSGRKTILIITACFVLIGLFHAKFGPTEYQSTATLILEVESGANIEGGGSLLQSLTGMNLSGSQGSLSAAARGRAPLPVNIYPLIVHSTDFQKDLIYEELEFSTLDTTMTIYDYFKDHARPPIRDRVYSFLGDMTIFMPLNLLKTFRSFLGDIRGLFSDKKENSNEPEIQNVGNTLELDDRLLSVTDQERAAIEQMRLSTEVLIEGSTANVLTTLPDPKAAALVNALLVERIQEYMTEYRIEKARQNLENVLDQYEEARKRYEEANMELARYQDQNLNISTATAQTQLEYLQDQRNLRYNVYSSLAQEVEQARLSLNQQIPVFNTLEKPSIPNSPTTGYSDLIIVFSAVLGLFFGMGWILLKSSSIIRRKDD